MMTETTTSASKKNFLFGFAYEIYGEEERMIHDHSCDFKVFPLDTYVEEVYDPATNRFWIRLVKRWAWRNYKAAYAHRILGKYTGDDEYTGFDGPQYNSQPVRLIAWRASKDYRAWGIWDRAVWRRASSAQPVKSWIDE